MERGCQQGQRRWCIFCKVQAAQKVRCKHWKIQSRTKKYPSWKEQRQKLRKRNAMITDSKSLKEEFNSISKRTVFLNLRKSRSWSCMMWIFLQPNVTNQPLNPALLNSTFPPANWYNNVLPPSHPLQVIRSQKSHQNLTLPQTN